MGFTEVEYLRHTDIHGTDLQQLSRYKFEEVITDIRAIIFHSDCFCTNWSRGKCPAMPSGGCRKHNSSLTQLLPQRSAKYQLFNTRPPRAGRRGGQWFFIKLFTVPYLFWKLVTSQRWKEVAALSKQTFDQRDKYSHTYSQGSHTHTHKTPPVVRDTVRVSCLPVMILLLAALLRSMNMSLTSCSHTALTSASCNMYFVRSEENSPSIFLTIHSIPFIPSVR